MIPLLLIGSFALIFISLPIPGYQDLMGKLFGLKWQLLFDLVKNSTFGIMSIFMVLSISYSYASILSARRSDFQFSPIINSCVALCSFVIISGLSKNGFSVESFGVTSTFEAIFSALLSSFLFSRLCSLKILRLTSYSDGASAAFNNAIGAVLPAAITILGFAVLHVLLATGLGITDIQGQLSTWFAGLSQLMASHYWTAILFVLLIHVLWFFGLHGSNVMEPVTQSLYVSAMAINTALVQSGSAPTEIFTKTFFDNFVLMGGCGSTLSLLIAIFIAGRHRSSRRLAKLSAAPVLFNINETVTFGIPIVLNPVYLVPFVLTPLLYTTISYLTMKLGLVPLTTHTVEWTTPILLSGYASTGSVNGSLLQLFNLGVGVLIYMPFVRLAEKLSKMQMKSSLKRVCDLADHPEHHQPRSLCSRQDDIGNITRFLISDLKHDLKGNRLELFYQPQTGYDGRIMGVEALLRWKHDLFGYIYPPAIIQLAEESDLIDELGLWIFDKACANKKELDMMGFQDISVSVNVSAVQLENESLSDQFKAITGKYGVSPDMLDIEITEQVALSGSEKITTALENFKLMGMKIAMDDFGMGHSSLMYLKQYNFDTIKLDGSLVREIMTNCHCSDIISSIVYLSESMRFSIIAEYVETAEQRDSLYKLGCHCYQGYLYSPALPFDKLIEYLKNAQATGSSPLE